MIVDIVAGCFLFFVGDFFAWLMSRNDTPDQQWLYPIWFAVGLIPLLTYLHYRHIFRLDKWDIVYMTIAVLIIAVASPQIGEFTSMGIVVVVAYFYRRLRKSRSRTYDTD